MAFWSNLKEGSDYFEAVGAEPKVGVCGKRYVFGGADVAQGNCSPEIEPAVAAKERRDEQEVAALVASGVQPIKLVYDDGSQHQSFRQALATTSGGDDTVSLAVAVTPSNNRLGDVSRPDGLAAGPREIVLAPNGKPKDEAPALAYAAAKPAPAAAGAQKPAVAAPAAPAPVTASAAGQQTPFYRRMMSGIGDLFTPNAAPTQAGTAAAPQKTADRPAPSGKITAAAE